MSLLENSAASNQIMYTEAYSEPCQTSKLEPFAKIVTG